MKIGYARVSVDDQPLDLQRDALEKAKCGEIYVEHASAKNTVRPQLEACLKSMRAEDALIVWRLDRLGRGLGDLIRLTQDLQKRGIAFAPLTERIDTRSPTGQQVFHMFESLAEFERRLIRERTMAGLKAARVRGRKGGWPRKLTPKNLKIVRAPRSGTFPSAQSANSFELPDRRSIATLVSVRKACGFAFTSLPPRRRVLSRRDR